MEKVSASQPSISCVADVSIDTVSKLLEDAGETCNELHDQLVQKVEAKRVSMR